MHPRITNIPTQMFWRLPL